MDSPQVSGFQFHYGSIKINVRTVSLISETLFQFHYGSIKIIIWIVCFLSVRLFQFHYGSIKIRSGCDLKYKYCVSIPLWFD